jgi:hypothetical protein
VKFQIDADPFRGEVFEYVYQDDLTWVEAGDVETVLGYTLTAFNDIERGQQLRGSAPASAAFLWIGVRRQRPDVTFEQVAATTRGALTVLPEPPDPTEPQPTDPTTGTPDGSTSPPSPTTTESDPGSGSD